MYKAQDGSAKTYQIYALIDPRDDAVRYVGIRIDADERFVSHLHDPNTNLPKTRWIRELRQEGLSPVMQILETIDAGANALSLACQRELDWINEMQRRGYPLLNVMGVTQDYSASYFPRPLSTMRRKDEGKPKPPERPIGSSLPMKQRLKVREVAEGRGWTQAKLQRAADVNSRTMSGIWHDPYRRVTYEVLVKIARALNVAVTELVEEEID
jgi:DNA-binding Xre family transcriptional regulator